MNKRAGWTCKSSAGSADLEVLPADLDARKRLQAETAAELDALLPVILDKASVAIT
jgi:hypothetical protein